MQRALRLWAFFGLVGVDALGGLQYLNKAVHGLQSVGVQSSRCLVPLPQTASAVQAWIVESVMVMHAYHARRTSCVPQA